LGEDECVALVVGEFVNQHLEFDGAGVVVRWAVGELGPARPLVGFDRVGAGSTGDGDDPAAGVAVGSEGVQAPQGSQVRVLNEVVDVVVVAEVAAETSDVPHGLFDEPPERGRVAVLGSEKLSGRVRHRWGQPVGVERSWNFTGRCRDLWVMTTINPPAIAAPRRTRGHARWSAGIALLGVTTLAACGSSSDGASETVPAPSAAAVEAKFTVAVSDPPIADLVAKVAGDAVEVVSVVPMGADGHTYEPVPSDAQTLARADVYIENGMNLNNVVTSFASVNYPAGTPHHVLSEVIPPAEILATDSAEEIASHGHAHNFNAHFWPDPNYAMLYVNRIVQILSGFDAADAAGYQQRGAALTAQLQQMDASFQTALATIPEANRKLVVYHDSWSYFGRRYGLPVVGAIQPTDFSEPSAAELRATIDEVRDQKVPAFFGSEVFPSDVLEAIEAESGAKYVADLSDDKLPGEPGSPEHSYVGMMVANTRAIVTALGGDPSALDAVVLAS
jgi:ABC-type Zn uptake system ZnuABC Zn-binding protein ZnuA